MEKRQRIIVIGQGYTSRLGVVRSIARSNIDCEIFVIVMTRYRKDGKTLNTKKPIDCYSKYVDQIYYCQSNDTDGLVKLLLTKCIQDNQRPIIISVGDFVTTVIDSHLKILQDYFLFSHIHHQQGAIIEWMNKEKQKALAHEVGLNIVESRSIEVKDGHFSIPSGINYPCFTKTRAYLPGCKQTLMRCDNEEELKVFISDLGVKFDLTLLVEDYKKIEEEYAVVGFSDGENVIIPGIIKILSLAHGNHFGVACRGEVMPVDGFEEQVSKFKRFILKVGYVGIFDIDFFYSDDQFYFGEMNLRMGGSGYVITKMGVNLPAMFINTMLGQDISTMQHAVSGNATFVNERMWVGDWYQGFINTRDFFMYLKKSDISFVSDKNDSAPGKALYKFLWIMYAKKILKSLIKKNNNVQ